MATFQISNKNYSNLVFFLPTHTILIETILNFGHSFWWFCNFQIQIDAFLVFPVIVTQLSIDLHKFSRAQIFITNLWNNFTSMSNNLIRIKNYFRDQCWQLFTAWLDEFSFFDEWFESTKNWLFEDVALQLNYNLNFDLLFLRARVQASLV